MTDKAGGTSTGALFTEVYRGSPRESDSPLFRRRLGSYVYGQYLSQNEALGRYLRMESGLEVQYNIAAYDLERLFTDAPVSRLLNLITLVWRFQQQAHEEFKHDGDRYVRQESATATRWRQFVERVLREENLGYHVDAGCGVRYLVDEEFEAHRETIIARLELARYAGVRQAFEDAHKAIATIPPQRKSAVRSAFESVEILFKLMFSVDRLTRQGIDSRLKPAVATLYSTDKTAVRAYEKLLEAFGDWVDGLHFYRHGQGEQEPVDPPLEFATLAVSSTASWLRLLLELDARISGAKK